MLVVSALETVTQTLVAVVKRCWQAAELFVAVVSVSAAAACAAAVVVVVKTGCCTRHTVTVRAH